MQFPIFFEDLKMSIAEDPLSLPDKEEAQSFSSDTEPVLELEELKTYFIRFYDEHIPDFFEEIKSRGGTSGFVIRSYPGQLFEINFSNSVGMTRIGPLKVRVKSKKIPEHLYHSMLDYIADKYANLVFSFDVPLGQGYGKRKAGDDIAYVEYLFLKRYLLDSSPGFDGIAALIISNPHMKIQSDQCISPIEKVSSIKPGDIFRTLLKNDGYVKLRADHPLIATSLGSALNRKSGRGLYPSSIFEERRYHSIDTAENRFVKHFLKQIQLKMESLSTTLKGVSGSFLNPDIEKNIGTIKRKTAMFLNDPIWHDVGTMNFVPANSQVLQRREGYRQLFSLYSLLQLCTRCDFDNEDFKKLLETKDTPTLFEYWSFFLVKDILDGIRKIVSCKTIITEDQKEQKVYQGINIQYEDGINLWFNKYCSGSSGYQPGEYFSSHESIKESYSHNFIPDIIVSKGNNLLIFDAKYKGKGRNGSFYGEDESGGISKWKDEDIDKMHTYREAIQNVVGAFILYPGEEAVMYPAHGAQKLYEGVGALPLQPMIGAKPVQKHLDDVTKIINDFIDED